MNLLSLFSGIGAFERALENLGIAYNLVGYCEIDKYASKAYSLLHGVPESMNYGDITKIDETRLPNNLDLITYGFPCQDISIAGEKKGMVDKDGKKTRSGLFFDAIRIIEATRPKIAIAENVKHLTSKSMKPVFDIVLKSLEEAGYNNYWQVMNCADYELPQRRDRVLIVSIRKDVDDGKFSFQATVPLTTCMGDFLDDEVPEQFYLSEDKTQSVITHNAAHPGHIGDRGDMPNTPVKGLQRPEGGEGMKEAIQIANLNYYGLDMPNRVYSPEGISPTLKTVSGGGGEVKILDKHDRYRKLTEWEYFRLMGFDDSDYQVLAANGISKTQIYKMGGNSIAVPVLEHLFRMIYPEPVNKTAVSRKNP